MLQLRGVGVGILTGGAFVAAIGLFMLGVGLRNVYRALASRAWPSVVGVVVESSTHASIARSEGDTRRSGTMYGVRTVVQYQVSGRDYSTGIRHFGQFEGSGDVTEATLEQFRYPVGNKVAVRHDPSDPSIAALHPGIALSALVLPFGGAVFLGMALLMLNMVRGTGSMGGVITIFAIIFCAIGTALLIPGVANLWHARASLAWPTTEALIVYGTPTAHERSAFATADAVEASPAPDSLQVSTAEHRLIYRYELAGQMHYNNVLTFGQLAGSSDVNWSSSIAKRYPLGHKASVAYSPTDPDLSTLEPGITTDALFLPGAGLAFLLFGLAVFLFIAPALRR